MQLNGKGMIPGVYKRQDAITMNLKDVNLLSDTLSVVDKWK